MGMPAYTLFTCRALFYSSIMLSLTGMDKNCTEVIYPFAPFMLATHSKCITFLGLDDGLVSTGWLYCMLMWQNCVFETFHSLQLLWQPLRWLFGWLFRILTSGLLNKRCANNSNGHLYGWAASFTTLSSQQPISVNTEADSMQWDRHKTLVISWGIS